MSGEIQQKIGQGIAKYRKAAGLTQDQLAAKLQVAHETVSRMERGVSMPSVITLHKIADALGVEVQEFFAVEGGSSDKERALDELLTLLKRRKVHEIRMVCEMARVAFGEMDRERGPKPPPKKIKLRPHKV